MLAVVTAEHEVVHTDYVSPYAEAEVDEAVYDTHMDSADDIHH